MNIEIAVHSGLVTHVFQARCHLSTSPAHFFLEAEEFYDHFGQVPVGNHYEIELVRPNDETTLQRLYTRQSPRSGTYFVCYPRAIPTPALAKNIFWIWCLGSVLTLDHRVYMTTILDGECSGDVDRFTQILKERYSIEISAQASTL
ncbi:MAG: hypothetical protein V4467_01770 [Patescibacteria group bacterium]